MHVSILVLVAFVLGYICHRWYANYLSRNKTRTLGYWIALFTFLILLLFLMAATDFRFFYHW